MSAILKFDFQKRKQLSFSKVNYLNYTKKTKFCMWQLHFPRTKANKKTFLVKFHGVIDLKVDMPILTCMFFTFNWLTLTSEMHFVKFHPEVASCLLPGGKIKYAPLGMRLLWKYIRKYFLVYQLISRFLLYLQNYKEFEAEILDLQSEKYGLSLISKNILLPVEPWGMRMWSA